MEYLRNVLSALIQNFDTVEKVIETSANSAGSALKENERYLDSIQGKIDQFNNAMQAMWSNTLDSDMVKGFVALGTEIIKIIDKIGLLNSALLAFGAFKGFGAIFGVFKDAGISVEFFAKKLGSYLLGINAVTVAETTLTQAQVAQKLTQQGLTAEQAQAIAAQTGLATSTANLSRETLIASLQAQGYSAAEAEAIATKIFGTTVTEASTGALLQETIQRKLANSALIQYAIQLKLATAEQVANMTITQLLSLSFSALGKAIVTATVALAKFLFTNPVGWVILAIGAIAGGIAIFNHFHKTTEELTEELNELKIKLQDIQSELNSVNSELEITNDRMAELLAKDKLSFTEKEELNNLQKQNAELQRQIDLLELKEKQTKKETAKKFVETMESDVTPDSGFGAEYTYQDGEIRKTKWYDWLFNFSNTYAPVKQREVSEDDYIQQQIARYQKLQEEIVTKENEIIQTDGTDKKSEKERKKLEKEKTKLEDEAEDIEKYINDKTTKWGESSEGLDYGINDETNAWLDYINNIQDKWAIASDGESAKTNALTRIFNKDENAEISEAIDGYVEALEKGDISAKSSIENIIKNNSALVEDIEASGLSINEAVDYFTSFASNANYATLDGKIKEISEASSRLYGFISGGFSKDLAGPLTKEQQEFAKLFDENGKVLSDAVAEYFGGEDGGISPETQAEIERLVQQIYDGKISVENALKQFEYFGIESTLDIYIAEVQTNFKDVFVEFEDADGLIDTFKELGEAIGSTADALKVFNKAEAEMANSGRVSIETALQLMEYTDDYSSILEVTDGKLRLVDGAEDALIQTRIDAIKTSAQASLSDATNAYNKAKLATQIYKDALTTDMSAEVVAKSWEKVLAAGAGLWEGIKSLVSDESWTDAYNRGYNATLEKITGYETVYDDSGLQALVDAEAEAKSAMESAEDRVNLANQLTPETLEAINDADDVDTKEDVVNNAWEKLVSKYENQLALLSNERDLIQAEIDKAEARGGKASTKYYEDLKKNSEDEKELLIQKKAALEEYLTANANAIDQDTWTEYNNEINETAVAIKECEVNTIEWAEAIREIDLHYFEQITNEVSRLGDELDFVNSLLEDEDVADENGNWSSAALTRMGMYTNQMEMAATNAARYQEEINDLNDEYENGVISEEQYQARLSDLVSGQQDAIMSYEDAKDSIVELNEARVDAIREGIEKEIEAYEDLIDAKKEELDAERDLHDFRENIKKQTKDISELERRIASLSGSSAASDIAERRRLEAQLMEAKEGLNDTYYDHSRDAQSAALDEENEAYALSKEKYIERLEEQLKDTETLISNSIMDVMLNADTVYNELNTMADTYGITLSDELTQPWKDASAQAIKWKDELKLSMTSGEYASLIGEGGAVTAFANGVATKLKGSWSQAQTAAKNYAGYLTGAELKNRLTNTLTGFGSQIQGIIDKWNGVKKAADDAYAAQTRKVTVGGNPNVGNGSEGDNSGSDGGGGYVESTPSGTNVTNLQKILNKFFSLRDGDITGRYDNATFAAVRGMQKKLGITASGKFDAATKKALEKYLNSQPVGSWFRSTGTYIPGAMYAKGTTGTTRDEWAITDEPQFGDELTMYATPEGTLSFMRAGSTVVPADITANLVEWGKLNPDMLNVNGMPNINMISNAVNKPEFNFTFDALVKAENITEETLPAVKKLVTQELNRFTKELNYALKGKGAR